MLLVIYTGILLLTTPVQMKLPVLFQQHICQAHKWFFFRSVKWIAGLSSRKVKYFYIKKLEIRKNRNKGVGIKRPSEQESRENHFLSIKFYIYHVNKGIIDFYFNTHMISTGLLVHLETKR